MRTLNSCDYPADRVMSSEYRDRSLDEAEETLLEETEYWHGMSVVGPEWFFTLEN